MLRTALAIVIAIALSGCAATMKKEDWSKPEIARSPIQNVLDTVPHLDGQKIIIAVYKFDDKTGQRKPDRKSVV